MRIQALVRRAESALDLARGRRRGGELVFKTTAFFDATDGSGPTARMMRTADGRFYRATPDGGPTTGGTVFSMSATRTVTAYQITRP